MTRFHPRRLGVLLLVCWLSAVGALWPRAAYAMSQLQYVKQFDWASMGVSVGIAVVGGVAPTLVALLTDQFVLTNILQRTLKDIGIAAFNGVVFFIGVLVVESFKVDVPDGIAFAGVLCAGWARRDFILLVSSGVKQSLRALLGRWLTRLGGVPADDATKP